MAPIGIDLLIVVSLAGGSTAMRVDGDVVGAEQGAAHPAVVPPRVPLAHRHYHQPMLPRLYVFVSTRQTNNEGSLAISNNKIYILKIRVMVIIGIYLPGAGKCMDFYNLEAVCNNRHCLCIL